MSDTVEKRRFSEVDKDNSDNANKKLNLDKIETETEDVIDIDEDLEEDALHDLTVEYRAGIREYIDSNSKGFFGIIKQRFILSLF